MTINGVEWTVEGAQVAIVERGRVLLQFRPWPPGWELPRWSLQARRGPCGHRRRARPRRRPDTACASRASSACTRGGGCAQRVMSSTWRGHRWCPPAQSRSVGTPHDAHPTPCRELCFRGYVSACTTLSTSRTVSRGASRAAGDDPPRARALRRRGCTRRSIDCFGADDHRAALRGEPAPRRRGGGVVHQRDRMGGIPAQPRHRRDRQPARGAGHVAAGDGRSHRRAGDALAIRQLRGDRRDPRFAVSAADVRCRRHRHRGIDFAGVRAGSSSIHGRRDATSACFSAAFTVALLSSVLPAARASPSERCCCWLRRILVATLRGSAATDEMPEPLHIVRWRPGDPTRFSSLFS